MGRYKLPIVFFALGKLVFIGSVVWFLSGNISQGTAGAAGECRNCHSGLKAKELDLEDIYEQIGALPYKHSVVEEEKCDQCHIVKGLRTGRTWELSSPDVQKEQIFFLKDLSLDRKYQVMVKVRDSEGNDAPATSLQFIPSQVTSSLDNDQRAPLIKDVTVKGIRQAVFLEAIIGWETDEPANSIAECGLTPQYEESSAYEKSFATGHTVTISGLKKGKQYRCRVVSRDVFGNTAVSVDFILDTSREVIKEAGERSIVERKRPVVREVNIFKIKGTKDIYLKLLSDKPVKTHIDITEPAEIDKHGLGLVAARVSTIDACVRCHPQGASHPVGVRSKGLKTTIPALIPTIEGGMITCVTCHYPHGGDKKHFARLDFGRELCIQCHKGEPYT